MPQVFGRIALPPQVQILTALTANSPVVDGCKREVASHTSILSGRTHTTGFISGDDGLVAGCATIPATINRTHGARILATLGFGLCSGSQYLMPLGSYSRCFPLHTLGAAGQVRL